MTTTTPKESGWREGFEKELPGYLEWEHHVEIMERFDAAIATAIAATEARVLERLADLETDIADKKKELGEIPENT